MREAELKKVGPSFLFVKFVEAFESGNVSLVRDILKKLSIQEKEELSANPQIMFRAIQSANPKMVDALCEAGISPVENDLYNQSPLFFALFYFVEHTGWFYLERDEWGNEQVLIRETPKPQLIEKKRVSKYLDIIQVLVNRCHTKINETSEVGLTALDLACAGGGVKLIKFLISKAGLNKTGYCDAGLWAVKNNNYSVFEYWLTQVCRPEVGLKTFQTLSWIFGQKLKVEPKPQKSYGPILALWFQHDPSIVKFIFDGNGRDLSASAGSLYQTAINYNTWVFRTLVAFSGTRFLRLSGRQFLTNLLLHKYGEKMSEKEGKYVIFAHWLMEYQKNPELWKQQLLKTFK